MKTPLFDNWTDKYDSWFHTPVGKFVRHYELLLLMQMLQPQSGERILDAGCGTGIFTREVLETGACVTGVDLSFPMLSIGVKRMVDSRFNGLSADMCSLPFADNSFDRAFSMTAIEFIGNATLPISELKRVVKPGGRIVVTTLNSLSPWAARRKEKAKKGHTLFEHIYFRSPDDMGCLVPENTSIKTAIHFKKDDSLTTIAAIEEAGQKKGAMTGAFLAVQWDNK